MLRPLSAVLLFGLNFGCAPPDADQTLDHAPPDADQTLGCAVVAERIVAGDTSESTRRGLSLVATRDLYECRALVADDLAACAGVGEDLRGNCMARWRFFHDARRTPATGPWAPVMATGIFLDCATPGEHFSEATCEQLASAIRAQDPARCEQITEATGLGPWCQALSRSDPARCGDDTDCVRHARRLLTLQRGGLVALARDGDDDDRLAASAALGRPGVCDGLVRRFVADCESAAR